MSAIEADRARIKAEKAAARDITNHMKQVRHATRARHQETLCKTSDSEQPPPVRI